MKRGGLRDEERSVGPMFPRLHVNDTAERGGPRAPPRNKMALYEQLSIPSQRFSSTVIPLDTQTNKPNSVVSSTQRSSADRNLSFMRHLHQPTTPVMLSEKVHAHESDAADETMMVMTQLEQGEKVGGHDNEFRVPVFVKARVASQYQGKVQHSAERESVSSISSVHVGLPTVEPDRMAKNGVLTNGSFRREERNEREKNAKAGGLNGSRVVITSAKEATESVEQELIRHDVSSFRRSGEAETRLFQEPGIESRGGDGFIKSKRDRSECESHCVEDHSRPNKLASDGDRNQSSSDSRNSVQFERVDKGDGESMMESVTVLDIAPDDVVGIIGQKHFWKARKAIANQQRVFAVQVFELHRLVKVQKLIAESPHLLLDGGAFLGKSSFKCSPVNKSPPKFSEKPLPAVTNSKDDFEKPIHKKECSTDNMSEKPSLTCTKNHNQSVNSTPYEANPRSLGTTTTTPDNKASDPWCFHQPPGPQWLVPMMSPSEGLVYKPYLGPGIPGAVYGGGYGPFGPIPAPSNYTNSPYGVQVSQHHQRTGGFPGISPPVDPTYFPHYGMPYPNMDMSASTGEQGNQLSYCRSGSIPGGASLNIEQQSSCNAPKPPQKSRPVSQAGKFQACKSSDLQQGSSASSPFEMEKRVEKRDPLPLFPVAPVVSEVAPQSHVTEQLTRAIKVVPHSRRTATESAARIFRSIQEERKQFN